MNAFKVAALTFSSLRIPFAVVHVAKSCPTLSDPRTVAHQAPLSSVNINVFYENIFSKTKNILSLFYIYSSL